MTKQEIYADAQKLPLKQRRVNYNRLIIMYNADTGHNLSVLTGCDSCIEDFEKYTPFIKWLNESI